MIQSWDKLLLPLIQMCRTNDREFDIRGVMVPLELHDIYLLMGIMIIQEMTHLLLDARSKLELLEDHFYGGALDAISDKYLNISRIMDLTTHMVDMMVA